MNVFFSKSVLGFLKGILYLAGLPWICHLKPYVDGALLARSFSLF